MDDDIVWTYRMINYKKHSLNNYVITVLETRTYEDFSKFLGTKPERLGIVSRLYEDLTAAYMTESLRNVFYQDSKSGNKYQSINAMYFEWEVD